MDTGESQATCCSTGILIALFVVIFSIYYWKFFLYLRRCGLPGPFSFPLVGNLMMYVLKGFQKVDRYCYKTYGETYGVYWGHIPVVVTTDQELIKQIYIKDFHKFTNRASAAKVPPVCEKSVFYLCDNEWRRVRSIMSPTFSGGKLRRLCLDLNRCSKVLTNNLEKGAGIGNPLDIKECFGAFTMDAIASTAFGLDIDSQNTQDDPFVKHAAKIFEPPSTFNRLCMLFAELFPIFSPMMYSLGLRTSFWDRKSCEGMAELGRKLIAERKQNPSERVDFMRLLFDAELEETDDITKGNEVHKKLTDEEINSQVLLFLIAGYETTASTLRFISYVLATHPDVDENLTEEINRVIGEREPTYEDLKTLKYMEQVIFETLRMYPPITRLFRQCTEDMTYEDIIIPKDCGILTPVFLIAHDPKCFPEPCEFRPERFAAENKRDLSSSLFLSFGFGPRHCLGMRLALVEIKLALIHMLRKIKFVTSSETQIPLQFMDYGVLLPTEPVKLCIEKRAC